MGIAPLQNPLPYWNSTYLWSLLHHHRGAAAVFFSLKSRYDRRLAGLTWDGGPEIFKLSLSILEQKINKLHWAALLQEMVIYESSWIPS